METKLERKFWIMLLLTAIPITDFIGVNWLYMTHTLVGLMKIALCILLIALVYASNVLNNYGAAFGVLGVIVIGVIWWIVDIFLVVLRKRL